MAETTVSAQHERAGKPEGRNGRRREGGVWSFLTWSFFLSQALAAEQAATGAAKPTHDAADAGSTSEARADGAAAPVLQADEHSERTASEEAGSSPVHTATEVAVGRIDVALPAAIPAEPSAVEATAPAAAHGSAASAEPITQVAEPQLPLHPGELAEGSGAPSSPPGFEPQPVHDGESPPGGGSPVEVSGPNPIGEILTPVVDQVVQPVVEVVGDILDPVVDAVTPLVGAVTPVVDVILDPLVDTVTPLVDVVGGTLGPVTGLVGDVLDDVAVPAVDVVGDIAAPVLDLAGDVLGTLTGALEPVAGDVAGIVQDLAQPIVENVAANVADTLSDVAGIVQDLTQPIAQNVAGPVADTLGGIADEIADVVAPIADIAGDVLGAGVASVATTLADLLEHATGPLSDLFESATAPATGIGDLFDGNAAPLASLSLGGLDGLLGTVIEAVGETAAGLEQAIDGVAPGATDALAPLLNLVPETENPVETSAGLSSGGSLDFSVAAITAPIDDLFSGGQYTGYGLTLTSEPETGSGGVLETAADLIGTVLGDGDATAPAGSQPPSLPALFDELRGAFDGFHL